MKVQTKYLNKKLFMAFNKQRCVMMAVCFICMLFVQITSVLGMVPIIESPQEKEIFKNKYVLSYTVTHTPGADLEFAFTHAPLPHLGFVPPIYSPVNIVPEQVKKTDSQTTLIVRVKNELQGDLRLKVHEKNSGSPWSESRKIRLIMDGSSGVAKLNKAQWLPGENGLLLEGKIVFWEQNFNSEQKKIKWVWELPDASTSVSAHMGNMPQDTTSIHKVVYNITTANLPKKGKVWFETSNGVKSNKVAYDLGGLPDLEIVKFNNVSNLRDGDSVAPLSVTVTNSGNGDMLNDTEIILQCDDLNNNRDGQNARCPFGFIHVPLRKLKAGETTNEFVTLDQINFQNWVTGKYIFNAKVVQNFNLQESEANRYNNEKQIVVDVIPADAQWSNSPKLLQIISPRQQQHIKSNLVLQVLVNDFWGPIELEWEYLGELDATTGAWPAEPEAMNVISQVSDFRSVIPLSLFKKKGKWRVSAYIKDEFGQPAKHPVTNEALLDSCDFYVENSYVNQLTEKHTEIELNNSIQTTKKIVEEKSSINQLTKEPPKIVTNISTQITRMKVEEEDIKRVMHSKKPFHLQSTITRPIQNQKIRSGEQIPLVIQGGGKDQSVKWELEYKPFEKNNYKKLPTKNIRINKGTSGTQVTGKIITKKVGYYRLRVRSKEKGSTWGQWRFFQIGKLNKSKVESLTQKVEPVKKLNILEAGVQEKQTNKLVKPKVNRVQPVTTESEPKIKIQIQN